MKLFKRSSGDEEIEVTLSNRTIFRALAIVCLFLLAAIALQHITPALVLIGTAFFLSLALNAPVHWLAQHLPGKKKGNRNLATTLSIIIIVLTLMGFLAAIVPPTVRQTVSFAKSVPSLISRSRQPDNPVGAFIQKYNLESQVDKYTKQVEGKVGDIGTQAMTTITKVGSSLFALLTVIVLTIMMLLEGPHWRALAMRLIPARKRPHIEKLGNDMLRVIQGYVNGQVTLAAIAAVLIFPVFLIMGISSPVALMLIVFICGLIPMVGHTIGAIICTVIALFTSIPAALVVLAYYILYQQIENYAVQPKVQANSTNMSPLLVFISVLIGGSFGGLLGALVAIPVAGCMRILVLDYLERRDILTPKEVAIATGEVKSEN